VPHYAMATGLERALRALQHAADRPGEDGAFADQVMDGVREAVGYDGYCLLVLDPETGLRSSMFSRHGLDGVADRLAFNEMVEQDENKYAELSRARRPVGMLGHTRTWSSRSPRLHEIIRPAGFTCELRLALRGAGRLFGALVLFRADAARPWTELDADAVLSISGPLTSAVRSYPLREVASHPDPLPPGVITLDKHNRIVTMSENATAWLHDVCAGGSDEVALEDVLRLVYDVGLAARSRTGRPSCRVRTSSGRWLTVQGERIEPESCSVVVVLGSASLAQVLPAASAWLGLTPREQQVARALSRGLSTRQIAKEVRLSELTVQDHLTMIYRKARTSGRTELVARLS
jgi:DNA-binding CsgD family transcriptional regulator